MLLIHANAFTGDHFEPDFCVRLSEGIITETGRGLSPLKGEEVEDAENRTLLPGFVDVHTHAWGGLDVMKGEKDIRGIAAAYRKLGVSAFLPTTMSASVSDTVHVLKAVRSVMESPEPGEALVAGAHMEAPFLSPDKCGAQRKECLRLPDPELFLQLCSGHPECVRMITLAPELPGAEALIPRLREMGITVSAGHTAADAETLHKAADLGLNHSTHTFNAQPVLHHRSPGVTGAALTDERVYCEIICDGFHLHPDIIRLVFAVKKADRTVIITDSMEAAGMPDGEYALGGQKVFVTGGKAVLADGTLAGSSLTMPRALQNLMRWGLAPEQVIPACTSTPAESVGLTGFGRLAAGYHAPVTLWDRDWNLVKVLG